jgi:hypothetical protein
MKKIMISCILTDLVCLTVTGILACLESKPVQAEPIKTDKFGLYLNANPAIEILTEEKKKKATPDSAWITINAKFSGKKEHAYLVINHIPAGEVQGHQSRTFQVLAGSESVSISNGDLLASNVLDFDLHPGETKSLICGCRHKGLTKGFYFVYCALKDQSPYYYVQEDP